MKGYIVWEAAACDGDDSSSSVCVCVWSWLMEQAAIQMCSFKSVSMQMFNSLSLLLIFIHASNLKGRGSTWADYWGTPRKKKAKHQAYDSNSH